MLLDTATSLLQLVLGEVKTTTECSFYGSYTDKAQNNLITPAAFDGVSNGLTAVTLVASPGNNVSREIKDCFIYNGDTVTHNVIIQHVKGESTFVFKKFSLAAGKTLEYNWSEGWLSQ